MQGKINEHTCLFFGFVVANPHVKNEKMYLRRKTSKTAIELPFVLLVEVEAVC